MGPNFPNRRARHRNSRLRESPRLVLPSRPRHHPVPRCRPALALRESPPLPLDLHLVLTNCSLVGETDREHDGGEGVGGEHLCGAVFGVDGGGAEGGAEEEGLLMRILWVR